MAAIRCGPARVPSRESPGAAAELLVERGYAACEVDFEGGFWMNWSYAEQFGASARERDIRLSLHAPIPAFLGHPERGKKYRMAAGMLDHSSGIAVACGAEPVVIHPGFLFGRERRDAISAVIEQLHELRTRLEPKGRAVPFGVQVMGRARELGTLDDVLAISSRMPWVRPVIDFANRNEKAHVPYGQGTLSAEPLADALTHFDRSATIIDESPDETSNQAIRALLLQRARDD